MKIIIKLEKEDIKTCKFGLNYSIEAPGVSIVFSPEALQELIDDIEKIKKEDTKLENI